MDRLCIEDSSEDRHHQINQMDRIYASAALTIVAAFGSDADAGLPGVGSTPRKGQSRLKIGDTTIISTIADPYQAIRTSTWAIRAWTLQEAVLSRRRLVFTDEQVYFECNAINVTESVNVKLDAIRLKGKTRMAEYFHSSFFSGSKGYYPLLRRRCLESFHWNHEQSY